MKKLLMGNEAIALGAIRAGLRLAAGYPGTPSSEILETVAKNNDGRIHAEWSANEKSAMEVAAGAAYAGARAMVTMKQVGLNVASDPLMSLNYVGVKGGMVVVAADDPGPISSQTEQDTRHYGKFAKIAVFDPSTPEEAYAMMADAFDLSEKYGRPVIMRPTTRVCHSRASVELLPELPAKEPEGFIKDSRWVIFPRLAYANHLEIEKKQKSMSEELSLYKNNILTGSGKKGIACGGVSYSYVQEALTVGDGFHTVPQETDCKLLKISAYPFPEKLALEFLNGLEEILVAEELDPVIERELITLCGKHGLNVKINGKLTGHMPNAGENTPETVSRAVRSFLDGINEETQETAEFPPLPARAPVLCAGCPHRASFFAVKEAAKGKKAVFSGDIGCYTLGNAQPLDMVDTCLCMGAGITVAQGINRIEPDTLNFAFIGDSTFFHTGIPGVINAVYNGSDIIVAVLDNSTTAMTGNQPHPGTGVTLSGKPAPKISIYDMLAACGVEKDSIKSVNPFDQKAAKEALNDIIGKKGARAVIFEAPCITLLKSKSACRANEEKCVGCGMCVKKLGCPAITIENKKATINNTLCTGCGLCGTVCAAKAIHNA